MNLVYKLVHLLSYCLLVTKVFLQGQTHILINENANNFYVRKTIHNTSTVATLKSKKFVLDSLICISSNGNRTKITYNYNIDLLLNYFTFAHWFNNRWVISDKHTNTYDSSGKLESVLWEQFNLNSGEWLKDAREIYSWDSSGNLIRYLYQLYNGQEFINNFKFENYYDASNNLIFGIEQSWLDSIWVNRSRVYYTYTQGNIMDSTLFQVWADSQWVNFQLNIFDYNENFNVVSNLVKRWWEGNWLDLGRGSFKYDINNNCVLETWEIANNNGWENWFRIIYEYDENNNLIHISGEEWENGQWVPENEGIVVTNPDGTIIGFFVREIYLYYSIPPTHVESEKGFTNDFNLFQNYPNPFNPSTKIRYTIKEQSFITLKVFDLLGREITTLVNEPKQPGEYEIDFDASKYELSSGVYLYQLKSGSYTATKKFVYLR